MRFGRKYARVGLKSFVELKYSIISELKLSRSSHYINILMLQLLEYFRVVSEFLFNVGVHCSRESTELIGLHVIFPSTKVGKKMDWYFPTHKSFS